LLSGGAVPLPLTTTLRAHAVAFLGIGIGCGFPKEQLQPAVVLVLLLLLLLLLFLLLFLLLSLHLLTATAAVAAMAMAAIAKAAIVVTCAAWAMPVAMAEAVAWAMAPAMAPAVAWAMASAWAMWAMAVAMGDGVGGAGGAGGAAGGLRQNELAGAGLALLSTLAGAGYQVVFKGYCGALSTGGVFLFLGLMGLAHLAVLWLFMPLLHVTGVERFVWPSARQWGVLELTSLVALCVNTLCMFTIHICSPLFHSVGMALTVPASYLCDLALGNIDALRLPTLGGVLLDTAGFVLLILSGSGQRSGTAADGIALRQVPYAAVATSDAHSDDDKGRDSDRDSKQ